MKRILVTNRYTGIPLEIVQNVVSDGFQLVFLQEQTEDGLCAKMGDIDYILAGGRTKITETAESARRKILLVCLHHSSRGMASAGYLYAILKTDQNAAALYARPVLCAAVTILCAMVFVKGKMLIMEKVFSRKV